MVLIEFCCTDYDLIPMQLFKLKKAYRKAAKSFENRPRFGVDCKRQWKLRQPL
jgi:hypothetical protein|tara:strand:- start:89 stop:247 length:159 start_codon:yes stop_codon:yes gene_type:complete